MCRGMWRGEVGWWGGGSEMWIWTVLIGNIMTLDRPILFCEASGMIDHQYQQQQRHDGDSISPIRV